MTNPSSPLVEHALEAHRRGYTPIPLLARDKKPGIPGWTSVSWESAEQVAEQFEEWIREGSRTNLGVLLGEPSGGLVDVDLDHPKASRLRDYFLPPTAARSGRSGRPNSHYWYVIEGDLPGTRQHKMPDKAVSVELRSTRAQTALPPSTHPSGEPYLWSGEPWGGEAGPARVNGQVLAAQVALLGLGAVLLDGWPEEGSRHSAYLALAGSLLSDGDLGVHPFWERNLSPLIRALAEATFDDDGPDAREREVIDSTLAAIRAGKPVVGFGKLAEIIGEAHVRQTKILVAEVESAAGYVSRQSPGPVEHAPVTSSAAAPAPTAEPTASEEALDGLGDIPGEEEARDPLDARTSSWEIVELDPYLSGQVRSVEPSVLLRDDGAALLYPGRVNMIYGSSESAKSWVALKTCLQVIETGERVLYLDFEDEPINTIDRLRRLGAEDDDIRFRFGYVRPEEPLAAMQRDRWGKDAQTSGGQANETAFERALREYDPALIVADGMTVLYGLHGLNTNDTSGTDVITSWLKSLTRNGRSTVVVIDHAGKGAEKGSLPIGSQHKVSMVQGTLLQAWAIRQPMPNAVGEIELVVLKDRPGQVRMISERSSGAGKAQVAAIVTMDSQTDPSRTEFTIAAPPQDAPGTVNIDLSGSKEAEKAEENRIDDEAVLALWGGRVGSALTVPSITDTLAWPESRVKRSVARLVKRRWIERRGNTKSTRYELMVGEAPDAPAAEDSETDERIRIAPRFNLPPLPKDDLLDDPGDPRDG